MVAERPSVSVRFQRTETNCTKALLYPIFRDLASDRYRSTGNPRYIAFPGDEPFARPSCLSSMAGALGWCVRLMSFLHPPALDLTRLDSSQNLTNAKLNAFEGGHGWFFWNFKTELEVLHCIYGAADAHTHNCI